MISFWVNRAGSFGIRHYCENRGRAIAGRFQTCFYDDVGPVVDVPPAALIFSGLDQLTSSQRQVAAEIWDGHARAAPSAVRLNDPRQVLLRFELLTTLHEEGLNTFRVFRTKQLNDVNRFPVFVREKNRHNGSRTRLLHTRWELARALFALRARGYRLDDLMIVEFCDTSRHDGVFRKYAAFKVGDRIMACHAFVSTHWCLKSSKNVPTEEVIREGIAYIETNPHESWLRRAFAVAGTDYGRIDYGVLDGVPQVWEVNLNPTIGRGTGKQRVLRPDLHRSREEGRELFHSQLRAAFVALDDGNTSVVPMARVTIGAALLARAQKDAAKGQRRRRALVWLRRMYDRRVSSPIRAVYSRLIPRG